MKTKVLLLGAVVAAFSFSTFAADALLSPRAQGNQIKVVSGMANDQNPALECRNNMVASPRAVAECGSHTTMPCCMPGCMKVAPLK